MWPSIRDQAAPPAPARVYGTLRAEMQRAAATARTAAGGTYIQTRAECVESEGLRDRTREGQRGTGD